MINLDINEQSKIMVVSSHVCNPTTANGRAFTELIDALKKNNFAVIPAATFQDGIATVSSDSSLCCIFVDWTSGDNNAESHEQVSELLREIRRHNITIPVLLTAEYSSIDTLTLEAMKLVDEFVWMLEDTVGFIASRANSLIKKYYAQLLPPFTRALFQYTQESPEYSWTTPGHQGGVAFTKTAAGRELINFFGENLFRSDLGVERTVLGSLLDHTGAIKESEEYAATIFGAHQSYCVLTGTSGSNRIIMSAVIGEKEIIICDRNCHKSIEQGVIMTGALPIYLIPQRNRYGIIGPIPKDQFQPEYIQQIIDEHPLKEHATDCRPVYAVVTNSTYDGICYHSEQIEDLLAKSVDQIHFDEAWFAYARFNPMFQHRYSMRGEPDDFDSNGPTIFATQSTHKMLAALSQSSYIHIRNGRKPIEHSRFNESYMMQSTTSPLYPLIAANEIGAAMMDGPQGQRLIQSIINEAVDFRLTLAKTHHEFQQNDDWFFSPWNAREIISSDSGQLIPFHEASREQLANDPSCWVLKDGDKWHGFNNLSEEWCLLDPMKIGILCPGMSDNDELMENGIPAEILSAYLSQHDIVPARTTDFIVLCQFTIGVTKGKWGTLLNVLLSFKKHYDANTPLKQCLPKLTKQYPQNYKDIGLKDISDEIFRYMKEYEMDIEQTRSFGQLPNIVKLPRQAFLDHMAGRTEHIPLSKLAGRTSAVGVIPYPPGIPIIMPGESFGDENSPWLQYIRQIAEWNKKFPGFEKILEGAEMINGEYHVWVLRE
ncbi:MULTISPECIES: Orn/Lys/Arg family decarboxylase [Photorhabdus]|uniref:Biodegradative arginine decarboxylase n=2 Tax=Photorhabdus asymbiotica TaxID=291112 RepID=C7BRL2_PHOAA|nr:Orn/Lys/Arg decarboxylase N-terminal domain-containing protein [Photorhabdus asymbiotica]RKS66635.1 arginine decarboxylase [Photorhabdus asymbiotica]CAQ83413.1 biodegradative arginine decarboxylase [Photorhabdus asymbiotica]